MKPVLCLRTYLVRSLFWPRHIAFNYAPVLPGGFRRKTSREIFLVALPCMVSGCIDAMLVPSPLTNSPLFRSVPFPSIPSLPLRSSRVPSFFLPHSANAKSRHSLNNKQKSHTEGEGESSPWRKKKHVCQQQVLVHFLISVAC